MLEPRITEEVVESDAGRWGRIIQNFPTANTYNTIPEGQCTITFRGEPQEELKSYEYDKGKNKGKRFHVPVLAILHLSESTCGKVVGLEHPLGLSRSAFQSLFAYLQSGGLPLRLSGRTFACVNENNKKYIWSEAGSDGMG